MSSREGGLNLSFIFRFSNLHPSLFWTQAMPLPLFHSVKQSISFCFSRTKSLPRGVADTSPVGRTRKLLRSDLMEANMSIPSPLCTTAVTNYVLPSVYTLLFFTGLLGNTLSLWVFIGRISPAASNPVNLCMTHLSVSNVLLSLIMPVMGAYYAFGRVWLLEGFLCQLMLHFATPVFFININMSTFILAWVALSRFATLVQHTPLFRQGWRTKLLPPPHFFAQLTRRRTASCVCVGVWVLAVGVTLPCSLIYSIVDAMAPDRVQNEVCYSSNVEIGSSTSSNLMWLLLAVFFLLYLMVLLFNAVVLRHIKLSRRTATGTATQALLARVYRNIVVIQVARILRIFTFFFFTSLHLSIIHFALWLWL